MNLHKAAGIIIQERKLLVTRSKGKAIFAAPGGVTLEGESSRQCLIRELREELCIAVTDGDIELFGTFEAPAAGTVDVWLSMDVYVVEKYQGQIIPDNEIEEIRWIDSQSLDPTKLGSIFAHEVIPRLLKQCAID